MRLKNFLVVVKDLERSERFYRDLFGLEVVARSEGNSILTQGLVLQDAGVWKVAAGMGDVHPGHAALLYFEDRDPERFASEFAMREPDLPVILPLTSLPNGQRILRIEDPDGHLIEVRNPIYEEG